MLKRKKYCFRRLNSDQSGLLPYETDIMQGLFEKGPIVEEEDLQNEFYTHVDDILNKGVKKEVIKARLFSRDPKKIRQSYYYGAASIAVLPSTLILLLNSWFDMGYFNFLSVGFLLSGLVIGMVGRFMPRRTRKGSLAYTHAMGFKEYLETAEKLELEHMTPQYFQNFLPYAMSLGVAELWAERFQDIYTSPPQWFVVSYMGFSTVYLATSIGDMSRNLNHTLVSSPSGSGFGFSGGGFGGGFSSGGFGGGGSSAV